MSEQERRAYLLSMVERYALAGRIEKGIMLDEYCANGGVGRKHAIACLKRLVRVARQPIGAASAEQTHPPQALGAARLGRPAYYAADTPAWSWRSTRFGRRPSARAASAWWSYCRSGPRTVRRTPDGSFHATPSAQSRPSRRGALIGCWLQRAPLTDNCFTGWRVPQRLWNGCAA